MIFEKLRKARIKELEEQLNKAQQDISYAWERISDLLDENARLKLQLKKAQEENAANFDAGIISGPACWHCPNGLHIPCPGDKQTVVICRLKVPCKMFGKDATKIKEDAENGTATEG